MVARKRLVIVSAFALVAGSVLALYPSTRPAHATTRPNIVVIEVDDMRSDELQYMTKTVAMLQGTTFSQSYVSTSLCCPSRAAFLSGQYTQNNHVTNNNSYKLLNHTNTVATWLHNSGYFTGILGKYLNGYGCSSAQPPGWDHWQALCSNIYSMFKYTVMDNGIPTTYGTAQSAYQTDVLATRSAATIDEASASGKPFFLWITPTAPHSGPGTRVASRYAKSLSTYTLPIGPSFSEANTTDKPAWVQGLTPISKAQKAKIQKAELNRLRMLLAADDLVAKVVNELTLTNQLANTEVIFTSDNGFMKGEHRIRTGKEVEYQESLSVPLVISGPGFPVATNNNVVMNTDLAPTIAAMAGVTPARVEDGRSLLTIADGTTNWPNRAIRHYVTPDSTSDGGTPPHPIANGIRARQYTYFEIGTGERELYDHASDPNELVNLAGQPRYKTLQAQLASMLSGMVGCSGAACQVDLVNIAPTAAATGACSNLVCTFDASGSNDLDGTIANYAWNFGDGQTGSGVNATHTYTTSGVYTVGLTITDDQGGTATDSVQVTGTAANIPPVAQFTHSCTDLSCIFDGSASNDPDGTISSYAWNFGDGKTATVPSPSHDYTTPGQFTVSLTVTDNRGATNTATAQVTVTAADILPTAQFSFSCVALTCTFDATASNDPDGTIVDYAWDYGDGFLDNGSAPTHTFQFAGVYAVTLVVTDDRGGTGTIVQSFTV